MSILQALAKHAPKFKVKGGSAPLSAKALTESTDATIADDTRAVVESLLGGHKDTLVELVEGAGGDYAVLGTKWLIVVTESGIAEHDMSAVDPSSTGGKPPTSPTKPTGLDGMRPVSKTVFNARLGEAVVQAKATPHAIMEGGVAVTRYTRPDGTVAAAMSINGAETSYYLDPNLLESTIDTEAMERAALKGLAATTLNESRAAHAQVVRIIAEGRRGKGKTKPPARTPPAKTPPDEDEDPENEEQDEVDEHFANSARDVAAAILLSYGDEANTDEVEEAITAGSRAGVVEALNELITGTGSDAAVFGPLVEALTGAQGGSNKHPYSATRRSVGSAGKVKTPAPTGPGAHTGGKTPYKVRKHIGEGSAQRSGEANIVAGAAHLSLKVSSIPEGQADDVVELARDAGGSASRVADESADTVTLLFATQVQVDAFSDAAKDRIPGLSISAATQVGESFDDWIKQCVRWTPEQFREELEELSESDNAATFNGRIRALTEAHDEPGMRKQVARFVHAVNPLVRKVTGRGISPSDLGRRQTDGQMVVTVPREAVEEAMTVIDRHKLKGEPTVLDESVEFIMSSADADAFKRHAPRDLTADYKALAV